MVTHSKALSTETHEEQLSNGWEKLLPLLDPVVVAVLDAETVWKKLDRQLVFWLTNTAAKFPGLNHLAWAGCVPIA